MTLRSIRSSARQYGLILLVLLGGWMFSRGLQTAFNLHVFDSVEHGETLLILLGIVIVFTLGFLVYELAKPTVIPSFVLAIFFGMVTRDALSFLVESPVSITTLITIGAVLILFGGGLDTPFRRFRELVEPILSLAIIGTLLNALLLSLTVLGLQMLLGIELPLIATVLVGAALASTDPAAIIPSFQSLVFRHPRVKHIAVSESAINDVVGAVLVGIFITLYHDGRVFGTVIEAYGALGTMENALLTLRIIAIGTAAGLLGFGVLHWWSSWKQRMSTEGEADAALFLGVPLAVFVVASVWGGSGYLAVFVTGLLFSIRSHMRHVEHYFNHTIEGFMKPLAFILLGALVEPSQLLGTAWIGIASGLIFMLALRPLVVFATLIPFHFVRHRFSYRELLFLSFVRETGVIPAVLLITISLAEIPGADTIGAIGLWIILLTLVIQPPLTPFVARFLGIAHCPPPRPHRKHAGPVAVLCSRGFSFPDRMRTVVQWAKEHGVENVALLHCPEDKYAPEFVADVKKRALDLFKRTNRDLAAESHREINFEFLCGPGLLQDNIESLIAQGDVSIIFVGSKMLDYRLEDVKRLNVPFFFM